MVTSDRLRLAAFCCMFISAGWADFFFIERMASSYLFLPALDSFILSEREGVYFRNRSFPSCLTTSVRVFSVRLTRDKDQHLELQSLNAFQRNHDVLDRLPFLFYIIGVVFTIIPFVFHCIAHTVHSEDLNFY